MSSIILSAIFYANMKELENYALAISDLLKLAPGRAFPETGWKAA